MSLAVAVSLALPGSRLAAVLMIAAVAAPAGLLRGRR